MERGETGIVIENIMENSESKHAEPNSFISEIEEKHRSRLLYFFMFSTTPFVCFFTVKNAIIREYFQVAIDIIVLASFCISYVFLKRHKSSLSISRILLAIIGIIFVSFITDQNPGAYRVLWCYVYPLVTFFLLGKKEGLVWSAIFLVIAMVLFFPYLSWTTAHFSDGFKLRFLITLGLVGIVAFLFELAREEAHNLMVVRSQELIKSYEELRRTQNQLVQSGKLASIGELAAGVAHELNQPLMAIRSTSQLIQGIMRKGNLAEDELHEQLDLIERNTKRMMTTVNHLRTFSRQSKMDFQPLDVNKVIKESFLMVGEQLRLSNIDVEKNMAPDLPRVNGDANQLEQVFLNLITNARDAVLTRDERRGKIEIVTRYPLSNHQSHVEILIKDNGGGISPENLERIFDPFFTTKDVGKGTGLGLSINYGIIKEHGGEIDVMETGAGGTTFRITLPVE